jgi:hypothetical protein
LGAPSGSQRNARSRLPPAPRASRSHPFSARRTERVSTPGCHAGSRAATRPRTSRGRSRRSSAHKLLSDQPSQPVPAAAVPATLASRGIGALPRTDHRRPLWTKRSSDWAPALARCPIPRTTVAICADRVRCAGCLDPALRLASGVRILRLLILHYRPLAWSHAVTSAALRRPVAP